MRIERLTQVKAAAGASEAPYRIKGMHCHVFDRAGDEVREVRSVWAVDAPNGTIEVLVNEFCTCDYAKREEYAEEAMLPILHTKGCLNGPFVQVIRGDFMVAALMLGDEWYPVECTPGFIRIEL